jgi:hypothetical protein
MKISNFDGYLWSYSTMKETRWCSLHRITGVAFNQAVHKYFLVTNIHQFGQSGLTGKTYISESRLSGVAYIGESLVKLSRPANALNGTILQKADCGS